MAGISAGRKLWQTLSSIKTGVILLILVVIVAAAGTVILQRPVTDPQDIERAYSPQMLRVLDTLGLTDVFHAWWFVSLLLLVSLSIIAASIDRFPNSWRYFARPYKVTDESFRKAVAHKKLFAVPGEEEGVAAAERAFRKLGLKPERMVRDQQVSLFAERHRLSEMAVYIVHASLLLIFLGGIVDGIYGWRGFVALTRGEQSNQVEPRTGKSFTIPFSVRCDGAGQENYADGTPKKWWSNLVVVQNGRDVLKKQIVVNDPLVYQGVRFYQASYGPTGKIDQLLLDAAPADGKAPARQIALALNTPLALDADTTVQLAEFIPDYVVSNGQVYARSTQVDNPAAHLVVRSRKSGKSVNFWLPAIPGFEENAASPYNFEARDLQMGYFTGLEVSHEPGQWGVWGGVLLMGLGLGLVFYVVHSRYWAAVYRTDQGDCVLWVGGAANRNRDAFGQRFGKLVEEIESELKPVIHPRSPAREEEPALAGPAVR
jgi:cytochrome c biogenesis protein